MLVVKHFISKKTGKNYFVLCLRLDNYDMMLSFKDKDILDVLRFYNCQVNDVYSLAVGSEFVIPIT